MKRKRLPYFIRLTRFALKDLWRAFTVVLWEKPNKHAVRH